MSFRLPICISLWYNMEKHNGIFRLGKEWEE